MAEEFLNKAGTQALINKIKSDFAKKATTLEGYGIEDAYTKTETDEKIAAQVSAAYKPKGSVAFADLPAADAAHLNFMYNITDDFTTTADFVEGAGAKYPAGTDVAIINVGTDDAPEYKYNALGSKIDLTGYWSKTELTAIPTADVEAMFED